MDPTLGWIVAAILGGLAAARATGLFGGSGSTAPTITPTTPTTPTQPTAPAINPVTPTTPTVPTVPTTPSDPIIPLPTITPAAPVVSTPAPGPSAPFNGPGQGYPGYVGSIGDGQNLTPEMALYAPDGSAWLLYQQDGQIVLYGNDNRGVLWQAGTGGVPNPSQLVLDAGSNLIAYDANGVYFQTNTGGHPGGQLVLQPGFLGVVDADGQTVLAGLWGTFDPSLSPSGGGVTGQLPAAPGRDALCRVVAGMNGIAVTTSQGSWSSWGPDADLPNLTAADRQAIYAAHRAAGCTHIVTVFFGDYTGASDYPGGVALNNDWRGQEAAFTARLIEKMQAGLWPVVATGADNGFAAALAALPALWSACQNTPLGDITNRLVVLDGFDSIDGIGNQSADNGVTESTFVSAVRAIIGQGAVLMHEIAYQAGVVSILTPNNGCWKDVDVWACETAGVMLGNTPFPAIVGGTWDSEHNDYAPVYAVPAGQERPWTVFVQWWRRMVSGWKPPADQPFNVIVPVTGAAGNPSFTGAAAVSSDSQGGGGQYTAAGTPRGRAYCCFFEYATYSETHAQDTPDDATVMNTRIRYGVNTGFDSVCL